MNPPTTSTRIPWWLSPSLWGLDTAFAAFCWSLYIAAHIHISVLNDASLFIVCGAVWICRVMTISAHSEDAQLARYNEYYKRWGIVIILLALGVIASIIWMMFYYVGQGFMVHIYIPMLMAGIYRLLKRTRMAIAASIALGAAFIFACEAPAGYYSISYTFIKQLSDKPFWALAGAMMLFFYDRRPDTSAQTTPQHIGILIAVAAYSLYHYHSAPPVQQDMYTIAIIALGSIHLLSRLRSRLSFDAWNALSWPMVALPALIGLIQLANK